MKQRHALIPTLRTVSDAEMISHQLMLRAGYIRQLAAGIYTYLPLACRVLHKIELIVSQEMDAIGAQQLLLPALHPAELWKETGRFDNYGPELVKLQDRHEREFIMGPTHEEVITDLLRTEIKSYKKLPLSLYQIQIKYRDERRPRSGLLRGREFTMKDAYSFHESRESLDETYDNMFQAYLNIFHRCGLDFRAVEADSGAIGGKGTHEFMVFADAGEDTIAICSSCDYAANLEMAEVKFEAQNPNLSHIPDIKSVFTPLKGSINEVADYLAIMPKQIVKSILFQIDDRPVLVLVRGDHEVNETKVKNILDAIHLELADKEIIEQIAGGPAGFVGPVDLKKKVYILADQAVTEMGELVVGANRVDHHFIHVQIDRDFSIDQVADVRNIQEGDSCPRCKEKIEFKKGIEVGHVFKLGTRYSEAMNARFLDSNGKEKPFIMGCYGIGISRTMASIIEQHHDDFGIIWPVAVAPYVVHIIALNMKDENQSRLAEELYRELTLAGIEVLFDDRLDRAGVKFKDADLIGIPVRITVGSKAIEGLTEIKLRRSGLRKELTLEEVLKEIPDWINRADHATY